jgi:hypothetical protein
MKLGLLVFGQFRSYKTWFPYNLQQLRNQFPDAEIDIFILSNRLNTGNYSKEAEEEIKHMCYNFNIHIRLFTFWEDHQHLHAYDQNLYEYNTKIFMKGIKPSYNNDWMMNMWFRIYCLWKMTTECVDITKYKYFMFIRAFDARHKFLKPILPLLLQPSSNETIFCCFDMIFIGSPSMIDTLYKFGNNIKHWKEIDWTNEFISTFYSFDTVLASVKQTYCSESQSLKYIIDNIPNWINIRFDHNTSYSSTPTDAYIDSRIDRQV